MQRLLLFSVFIIATCGLIYELVAGTLASYLLGDSVTQFSTVIGVYLFSMGIGSWFSKFFKKGLITTFIRVELLIALVGGFSAAFLFLVFEWVSAFRIILYGQVGLTGILVGLEIPLMMRILKDELEFSDLVSKIFTFDYIGALAASVLFPLFFVPWLGLVRTSFLFGILNTLVAIWTLVMFRNEIRQVKLMQTAAGIVLVLLLAGFMGSEKLMKFGESMTYPGSVIYAKSSPYQRLVLSRKKDDLRLYLNGNLQFSSRDEYRYHEALVHPGMASVTPPKKVLVLGGGDGLAVREILKYPSVDSILLVDLDPAMTQLFKSNETLLKLNEDALSSPKVRIINADAFQWIRSCTSEFDFITVDFPDPSNFSLGKLYSLRFYRELNRILAPSGALVIQSTSPYVAPNSFWCVNQTLQTAGFQTLPYHCYVPSFGEWGFIIGHTFPLELAEEYPAGLKFLSPETFSEMRHFPIDMAHREVEANKLNNQVLVQYFEKEWSKYVD